MRTRADEKASRHLRRVCEQLIKDADDPRFDTGDLLELGAALIDGVRASHQADRVVESISAQTGGEGPGG